MITSTSAFGMDCEPSDEASIDPMTLLAMWTRREDGAPPPLMSLATNGIDGFPRVRHVLLTESDDRYVYFHTDTRSEKAAQLGASPRAACGLAWPAVGRQVVLHGEVRVADAAEMARAYAQRSRYLQLLAWCNDSDSALSTPQQRHERWARFDAEHHDLEAPPTWIGYAVVPQEITFWRGDPDGPSRRVRFAQESDGQWSTEVLAG